MSEAELRAEGVSVLFPMYHGSARSLKKTVLGAAGRLGRDRRNHVVVQALRDISFTLYGGDRLGLIGANGAGKTTLLRTLAGIYEPVGGRVCVHGRLHALLDASLGMNFDLTGYENIRLRGLYSGLSNAEIARLEQDVAEFAGLGDFLGLPVRVYSAGMVVRLGFTLATAMRPQILLMDEWILAGDAEFMERARGRLEKMVREADILVLSSHSAPTIRDWCTRLIWLENGIVRADGPTNTIADSYFGPDNAPFRGLIGEADGGLSVSF